jgi:hypothetical protein
MSNLRILFSLTHLVTNQLTWYRGIVGRGCPRAERQSDRGTHHGPRSRYPEPRSVIQPPSIRADCHSWPAIAKVQL